MTAGDEPPSADRRSPTDGPEDPPDTVEDGPSDAVEDRAPDAVEDGPSGMESPASESSDAGPTASEATANPEAAGPTEEPGGRRAVEVPPSLYKVVTVFSTLLAVLFVVAGFGVLDMATTVVANPPASLILQLLALVGLPMQTLTAHRSTLALAVGLLGLALVVAGAGVYVYGSRFRAPGMGKPKDEADEGSGNG